MILAWLLACSTPGTAPRPVGVVSDPPIRVAVVLGYDPQDRASDTAEAGARRMGEALTAAGWRVASLTADQATAEALQAAVGGLVAIPGHVPSPEDRLLVYVSAHGERARDAEGALTPAVRLAAGSASVASLLDQLDTLPVLRKALVLDSCFPSLPPEEVAGRVRPRSTLVLTAAGADEAAGAVVEEGGIYTSCLLQSWSEGSLLRAQRAAQACVALQRPEQKTQVYPPDVPVFDLPLGEAAAPWGAVLDGLTPTLPPGMALTVDGAPVVGGLLPLSETPRHTFALRQDGATVAELTREGPTGTLIGLAPAPDQPPGPDWIRLLPEAAPRDPVFREIAHASGLSDLVAGGHPQGAVAVSLDGNRAGWFITRSDAPPVYAVNLAKSGEDPRYGPGLDLSKAPAAAPQGFAARVVDLNQDGHPEVCYPAKDHRLVCVDVRGLVDTATLPSAVWWKAPLQADLDGDGDLDLLAHLRTGWQIWTWEAEDRRYRVAETLASNPTPSWAKILDLDDDGRPDLLFGGDGRIEARFFGIPGQGTPWATALAGRVLGLAHAGPEPTVAALDGRWSLLTMESTGSAIYPVGPMRLGPRAAGAGSADESSAVGVLVGDLDLDGALDLVHVHRDTYQPPHQIFLRRASLGGWARLTGVPGLDLSTDDQGAALDDVDGDGDLDILALNGEELTALPPEGCCRLFVSDASAHAQHLAVDVDAGGSPFIGAEVRLAGGTSGLLRLDGARALGAALFGLGSGGVPGSVSIRWPDGSEERAEASDFTAETGGWRVRLRRRPGPSGRLLVGPFVVDLGADPATRVRRAAGLKGVADVVHAWPSPDGLLVFGEDPYGIVTLDDEGRAQGLRVPARGCYWGGWLGAPLHALALGCSEQHYGEYTEALHLWRPGRSSLDPSPQGAPTFTRTLALDGDRVWISSGRRRVEARAAEPALSPTDLSLAPPEGAVDRTFVFVTPQGQILVADQGAGRVEVWSGAPPTLQRLVPVGSGVREPVWDPGRGAWLVPVEGGIAAVDPDRDQPVARWELPGTVEALVLLDGSALAALLKGAPPELRVLDQPGAPPRLVITLPPFTGAALARLDR